METTTLKSKWDREADVIVAGFGGAGALISLPERLNALGISLKGYYHFPGVVTLKFLTTLALP
jgi:hypothetical protein